MNDLLKIDARMTTRQVARSLSISTGSAFKILMKILGVSCIAAGWIPHLLTDGQKRDRVLITRKLLKVTAHSNNCNSKSSREVILGSVRL